MREIEGPVSGYETIRNLGHICFSFRELGLIQGEVLIPNEPHETFSCLEGLFLDFVLAKLLNGCRFQWLRQKALAQFLNSSVGQFSAYIRVLHVARTATLLRISALTILSRAALSRASIWRCYRL